MVGRAAYRLAPEVTRRRIYLETLNDILPRMGKKIIVDDELDGLLPLLELGPVSRLGEEGGN